LHTKHKMMSSNLSKELRKKYEKRNFPLRKGDSIKILRGEFKGKTGKIETVNLKRLRVIIEGIYRTKKDGTKVGVYFNPSNLQIKELNLEDGKRKQALERKAGEKTSSKDLKNNNKEVADKKTQFKKLPKQEEKQNASEKKEN